jgi:hypothetical protein
MNNCVEVEVFYKRSGECVCERVAQFKIEWGILILVRSNGSIRRIYMSDVDKIYVRAVFE